MIIAKAVEEEAFAKAEAARRAEEEAVKAAERAEIARLREELDSLKTKLDTTLPSRRVSARERLSRRRGSPAAAPEEDVVEPEEEKEDLLQAELDEGFFNITVTNDTTSQIPAANETTTSTSD